MEQQENNVSYQTDILADSPSGSAEPATVGQRFLNYVIDIIVLYVVMFTLATIFLLGKYAMNQEYDPYFEMWLTLFLVLVSLVYYVFCEGASRGRSVGKLITRTKVVRDDESEITWKDAVIRTLCRLIPFEPFTAFGGYPLHDKLSHTKVIRIRK